MKYTENDITISTKDLKGDIKDFPIEIVCRMCYEARLQGSSDRLRTLSAFYDNRMASDWHHGFIWDNSSNRHQFWEKTIRYKNFDMYFDEYQNSGIYTPEEDDEKVYQWYKPGMPKDLVNLICKRAGRLKNCNLINLFVWTHTPEGYQYWNHIAQTDWRTTSYIYEDAKIVSITFDINNINQQNNENNEIRLQKPKAVIVGGTVPKGNYIFGKKGKFAITVESLSYGRVLGS